MTREWDAKLGGMVEIVERRILAVPEGVPILGSRDPNMKVMIGIPMERTMHQLAFFGFWEIAMGGWPLTRLPYTRNDVARQQEAEFLMQSDYTHLCMLDSDHTHPGDIVQRLARWFIAYPDLVQVVGGLNYRRGEPYDPCAFVDPGDGHFRRMAEWGVGAIEVDALGTGCIMIARSVFETLPQPWFGYDYTDWKGWPGTDMWFSALCKKAGITLWCDTTTTSPHLGDMFIGDKEYRQWIAEHGIPSDQTTKAVMPMIAIPGVA